MIDSIVKLINALTTPQTVQATLVILFSVVIVVLAITNRQIPEIIGFALSAIIGYYFGDAPNRRQSPT
jgi:hypothetical protein